MKILVFISFLISGVAHAEVPRWVCITEDTKTVISLPALDAPAATQMEVNGRPYPVHVSVLDDRVRYEGGRFIVDLLTIQIGDDFKPEARGQFMKKGTRAASSIICSPDRGAVAF